MQEDGTRRDQRRSNVSGASCCPSREGALCYFSESDSWERNAVRGKQHLTGYALPKPLSRAAKAAAR
jgi:hypothetical protein